MAADYTSGSAASFSDVLTAIENFLTSVGGWAAQAGPGAAGSVLAQRILTKGDLVFRFAVNTAEPSLYMVGATGAGGGASTGDAPFPVKLSSPYLAPITFPLTYEIHWNDDPEEVYVVVSYGGNKYQHMHFGESDIPDIGGTGAWCDASIRGDNAAHTDTNYSKVFLSAYDQGEGTQYAYTQPYYGLSCGYFFSATGSYMSSLVHCGLEGADAWRQAANGNPGMLQQPWNTDLLVSLPSTFNEAEVLVPIRTAIRRVDNVNTVVVAPRHSRYMRIDNVQPGEIITYGGDQWKCYPLYAKNTAERNGRPWADGANHSGTFGVAIRYAG